MHFILPSINSITTATTTIIIHILLSYLIIVIYISGIQQQLSSATSQVHKFNQNDTWSSRSRRAAIANPMNLWPGGIIPYEITFNYSGDFLQMIHLSMQMWMEGTCILFTDRESWHTSWLRIQPGVCGCCSQVGRQVLGPQYLYLGEECDKPGIMAHEFGHAIGFWHEHTRPDRDDYIYVIDDNVDNGQRYNFAKKTHEDVNSLGEPYDPQSIMHYAANTFSKSDLHFTIMLKANDDYDSGYDQYLDAMGQLGQRVQPSLGDILQTNKLYRCPACGGNVLLKSPSDRIILEPMGGGSDLTQFQYCAWRLITAPGNRITIDIDSIELYEGQIAIIYDTYQRNLRILGYVNGRECILRNTSTTSSNVAFIELWGANVQEHFESIPKFSVLSKVKCGGRMIAPYAFISNPAYPNANDQPETCEWLIVGNEKIQINIIVGYSLISDGHGPSSISFFEGGEHSSAATTDQLPLIRSIDSSDFGQKFYLSSRSNSMKIRMSNDYTGTVAFRAVYKMQVNVCATGNGGCEQICNSVFGSVWCECDIGFKLESDGRSCRTLTSIINVLRLMEQKRRADECNQYIRLGERRRFFMIKSPRQSMLTKKYPANLSCNWLIEAPARHKITFKFDEFEIEGSMGMCTYDKLRFTPLHPKSRQPLGSRILCGNQIPPPFTSRSNLVNVSFVTDDSNNAKGFVLKFKI